jgi:hypothetical protein
MMVTVFVLHTVDATYFDNFANISEESVENWQLLFLLRKRHLCKKKKRPEHRDCTSRNHMTEMR